MDESAFDAATMRVTGLLSRRRSLGLLVAVGLSGSTLAEGTDARRKKKKNKKSKKKKACKCDPCSTCIQGECVPLPDGRACGVNGVCSHRVCVRSCTYDPETYSSDCPAGQFCASPVNPSMPSVCTSSLGNSCETSTCGSSAECPAAQTCVRVYCENGPVENCISVTPA